MVLHKKEFGFYPHRLWIEAGPVTVSPLPDLAEITKDVLAADTVEDDWVYAPPQQATDIMTGRVRELPYASRVFGLPNTHLIKHADGATEDHLDFHIWALSFFVGMRLTAEEAGFLDATPLKPGKLVDFFVVPGRLYDLPGTNLTRAVELAEDFWQKNLAEPLRAGLYTAAVHALFLGQRPQNLEFESFVYFYTAIDACYRLTMEWYQPPKNLSHASRIHWMCTQLGAETPNWADPHAAGRTEVAAIRNKALHEALFMDAPLGFAYRMEDSSQNLTLEMRALICRLLVALIGGRCSAYVQSRVDTRGTHRLDLSATRKACGSRSTALPSVTGD